MSRNYRPGDTPVFIRWLGGKRWLSDRLVKTINDFGYERYIEPFLGGGSVFFALKPNVAILSDINPHLINAYKMVRSRAGVIKSLIGDIPVSERQYSIIKKEFSSGTNVERAAKFLYLNRVGFSGIFRVNALGDFNVPYGGRGAGLLVDTDILHVARLNLRNASLTHCDFNYTLALAGDGDLVYCDPPYYSAGSGEQFDRYNERIFSWDDQRRLASGISFAVNRGARVLVSNANCLRLQRLYGNCTSLSISKSSRLAVDVKSRATKNEALYIFPALPRMDRLRIAAIWEAGDDGRKFDNGLVKCRNVPAMEYSI